MNTRKSFFDTIYLLFILGKFFGISCYSISKTRRKYKTAFGMTNFFQITAYVGVLLILLSLNLQTELNNDENNTRIFNQTQKILIVLSLAFVTVGLVIILIMRSRYWDIANRLNEIDHQMMQLLKIEMDYGELYGYTIVLLSICCSSLVVVYIAFGYYSFVVNRGEGMMAQYIAYVIVNSTTTILTVQFKVFMYSMYMIFSTLNGYVETNTISETELTLTLSKSLKLQESTLSIARITDQLNNVVSLLSLYFSIFTVSSTVGVFCITVFNLHNFYRVISGSRTFEFYLVVAIYEMIGLQFGILLGLGVMMSSKNTYEAKRMGVLVHKVIARTTNRELVLNLKILSMQILHRSPNFSFGLFSMNWQFVFSFVASVASYLFNLIQFQMYDEKAKTS